jgi:ABC-type phosphate/phosphonate transport system substrate-binding protein
MKPETPQRPRYDFGCGLNLIRDLLAILGLVILAGLATEGSEPLADGATAGNSQSPAPSEVVRIGIAPGTWSGVNRNDATAAITAWAKLVMKQHGAALQVDTKLFESDDEMGAALRCGHVDAVSMLAHQFLALEPALRTESVFLAVKNHSVAERYVLLVHRDGGIEDLSGLRGGRLLLEKDARSSLAPQWLETLLARGSLAPAAEFFKNMTRVEKPSKAVLQVFFRQAEACLVVSNVFALAGELNPQLHKQLRVLAVSPEVVPSLFYFRPGHASNVRAEMEPAILSLHETVPGQQVLTVFQCEQMVKRPISCFDSTRELLATHERLCGDTNRARAAKLAGSTQPFVQETR